MSLILSERVEDHIWYVTLNRPERLNAVTVELLAELRSAIDALAADEEVRVIILRGAGRAFTSGADFGAFMDGAGGSQKAPSRESEDVAAVRTRARTTMETGLTIWDAPKPVIAQVHGYCFGLGVSLSVFCDLVFVAEDTVIGWPIVPIGAGFISPIVSWLIGIRKAKEFSYLVGSRFTGREAVELGWANHAFPADQLAEETLKLARRMAKVPPGLMVLKKQANNRLLESMGFRTAVLAGAEYDAISLLSDEGKEIERQLRDKGLKGLASEFTQ